jgi:ribosomal RNA-processing protein 8
MAKKRSIKDVTKEEPVKRQRREQNDSSGAQWSKSKKKRMRKIKAKRSNDDDDVVGGAKFAIQQANSTKEVQKQPRVSSNTSKSSSSLQKSFQERLTGSRFRILNEELYTTTSTTAFARFQSNPNLFDEYHQGFRHQVEQWPINPVDVLVKKVKATVSTSEAGTKLVVADFGCGDAELARQLQSDAKNKDIGSNAFVVHSFDLVAGGPNSELITACDVANTPLATATVDIGIFCLSLMGTNLADFVREAHRVLKLNGVLHIADVRSRFEGNNGNSNNELNGFVEVLENLGFDCIRTDRSNKMFVLLELKKNGQTPKKDLSFTAKPCIYKRR